MKARVILLSLALVTSLGLGACTTTTSVSDAGSNAISEQAGEDAIEVTAYIANGTGLDLTGIYMSVSGEDSWSDNLIDGVTMADGTYTEVTFTVNEDTLTWDLLVEDADGADTEWENLDISSMPVEGFFIELTKDGDTGNVSLYSSEDSLSGEYTLLTAE